MRTKRIRVPTRHTTVRYVRLDDEVWQKVAKLAKREWRPITLQIEQIIMDWFRQYEEARK